MRVGFIGLGNMGGRLATRLAAVSDLCVYDMRRAAMDPFEGLATLAASIPAAGAGADVVAICVRTDAEVNACVDAVLPAMESGATLMVHSTVSPATVRAAYSRAAPMGIDVVDAAVTTTRFDTTGPFVLTMTGGDEQVVERLRSLLDAYSTETVHVGPLGSAMALKIINNLVSLVEIVVAEEAFRLARESSVAAEHLTTVMTGNGALTPTMSSVIRLRENARTDTAARANQVVQAENGEKDLALAEALARDVGTTSESATFAKGRIRFAMTAGLD